MFKKLWFPFPSSKSRERAGIRKKSSEVRPNVSVVVAVKTVPVWFKMTGVACMQILPSPIQSI